MSNTLTINQAIDAYTQKAKAGEPGAINILGELRHHKLTCPYAGRNKVVIQGTKIIYCD